MSSLLDCALIFALKLTFYGAAAVFLWLISEDV